jgi:hypothetical protein
MMFLLFLNNKMIVVPAIGHDRTSGFAVHALPKVYKATNVPENICGQSCYKQLIMHIKEKKDMCGMKGETVNEIRHV